MLWEEEWRGRRLKKEESLVSWLVGWAAFAGAGGGDAGRTFGYGISRRIVLKLFGGGGDGDCACVYVMQW